MCCGVTSSSEDGLDLFQSGSDHEESGFKIFAKVSLSRCSDFMDEFGIDLSKAAGEAGCRGSATRGSEERLNIRLEKRRDGIEETDVQRATTGEEVRNPRIGPVHGSGESALLNVHRLQSLRDIAA